MLRKRVAQLALVLLSVGISNVGCAQQETKRPTGGLDKGILEAIRQSPVTIIMDREGDTAVVGKGQVKGEQCYKTEVEAKRNQGKVCGVFQKERLLQDVQTYTVLKSKGSFMYCYVDGNGILRQICYDDNWVNVPCSSL